jgi:hypothetical protein
MGDPQAAEQLQSTPYYTEHSVQELAVQRIPSPALAIKRERSSQTS